MIAAALLLSIELILDASGSMNAPLEGATTRIAGARTAIEQLVTSLPDETRIAFRAYGHQSPREKKDCNDTAVLVPFTTAADARAKIVAASRAITAQGYTPITTVLGLAAKDFGASETGTRTIILVSDGKETCAGDPCATARALREANANLVIHTVGLGVDEAAMTQLQCIARVTGGTYFDATTFQQLATGLATAARTPGRVPPPVENRNVRLVLASTGSLASHRVFDASGKEVGTLTPAQRSIELPAGLYSVAFGELRWSGIDLHGPDDVILLPGLIQISNLTGTAQVIEPETAAVVARADKMSAKVVVLPGLYNVRIGKAEWPNVRADAGKTVTLALATVKVTGMPMTGSAAITDLKGTTLTSINAVSTSAGLPPGDYIIKLPGGPRRITLQAGQTLEIHVAE